MRSVKALELINAGKIEELKSALEDEIYQEALKSNPSAKKRYAAMKRYFKLHNPHRECLEKPCKVEYEGRDYISFTNSWSLALTTESCGEIELFDTSSGNYPDVTRLIKFNGIENVIDFNKVVAEAKSKGYKLTKSEMTYGYKYLMYYDGSYYKVGLLDATFGIINDGYPVQVFKPGGPNQTITIKNNIGVCLVLPVRLDGGPSEDMIVINATGDGE